MKRIKDWYGKLDEGEKFVMNVAIVQYGAIVIILVLIALYFVGTH